MESKYYPNSNVIFEFLNLISWYSIIISTQHTIIVLRVTKSTENNVSVTKSCEIAIEKSLSSMHVNWPYISVATWEHHFIHIYKVIANECEERVERYCIKSAPSGFENITSLVLVNVDPDLKYIFCACGDGVLISWKLHTTDEDLNANSSEDAFISRVGSTPCALSIVTCHEVSISSNQLVLYLFFSKLL